MKNFADKFLNTTLQPQVFSLLLVTIILVAVALFIYYKTTKQPVNKAPRGALLFAEQYVMGVDNLFHEATENRFEKPAPYIFTLISFLLVGNLLGLVGLEPPATSYSVTLTIGLVSWIGIYVTGLVYQKLAFFKRFYNPVNLIGQFAPLISLSFRLFGNLIGGATIMALLYYVTGALWSKIPVVGEFNLLGATLLSSFHAYFDVFSAIVQAFVFTMLSMIYWVVEAQPVGAPEKARAKTPRGGAKAELETWAPESMAFNPPVAKNKRGVK